MDEKQRAKQIILEIIRQAGGSLTNKTNLYKAFYYAHLRYAAKNPDLLSTWPIVRMPMGPGIDKFDVLIGELVAEGMLEIEEVRFGEHTGFRFILTEKARQGKLRSLSEGACNAIASGVDAVKGKTADRVSQDSHDQSRTWRDAKDGDELPIYADLFSDEEYADAKARAQQTAEILRRLT
jgi:hypothetical protein